MYGWWISATASSITSSMVDRRCISAVAYCCILSRNWCKRPTCKWDDPAKPSYRDSISESRSRDFDIFPCWNWRWKSLFRRGLMQGYRAKNSRRFIRLTWFRIKPQSMSKNEKKKIYICGAGVSLSIRVFVFFQFFFSFSFCDSPGEVFHRT